MGCFSSKPKQAGAGTKSKDDGDKLYELPRWKSPEPMTRAELEKKREEFWDTSPHYGGDRVIWDALKAAVTEHASDPSTRKLILDSAGVVVGPPDLTVCYDERGAKYELPKYVLSDPTNITKGEAPSQSPLGFEASHATQAELLGR